MRSNGEIDKIDLKILDRLEADARTDLKDIAKECSLTPSAIVKRVKKLKATKIIVGTHLDLKRGVLGYPQEATIGITAENSRVDQIAQKVRAIPNVMVCAKSIGRYNLFAHVFARDLPELDNVTHLIKNIEGIRAITINIHVDDSVLDLGEKTNPEREHKIDETDLKIIEELLNNAQTPFARVAKTIGISHETVRSRYEKLRKEAIIRKCSVLIDRSKIGYQGTAFFLISCSKDQSKQSTYRVLKELHLFYSLDLVIGGAFDIYGAALVKDLKDLGALTNRLEKIPQIENLEASILFFTYYSYIPKPLFPYKCDSIELS